MTLRTMPSRKLDAKALDELKRERKRKAAALCETFADIALLARKAGYDAKAYHFIGVDRASGDITTRLRIVQDALDEWKAFATKLGV